ncbi:hypothetical protein Mal64_06450 [Pseudobythopirellula maris]|uniref:BNR/Asp-box repeat protein n=1 Tax=Pseudobythopirellula maris TaxID=2527991 RepID=A0A5C5ZSM8_9BACT|nr:BNR repeat-containing protein [Pseudobythopirellula maris]TWT90260.1 hypothetical protein Mal64_06450 [Pseudobythopirellula maris]
MPSRIAPLAAATLAALLACAPAADAVETNLIPIDQAFAANSMNHVSFRQSSIMTVGEQQFAAYYDDAGLVTVARRTHSSNTWDVFNTAYTDNNSNLTDDHNVITFGVDGDGFMHLSWGMHDDDLRYIKSDQPVTGATPISFGSEIPMVGDAEGLVTYPQFYNLPGGDLMFLYRTGGSGNGDTQVNRYDLSTGDWSPLHRPLFDGSISGDGLPSVNNYPNTLAFDSQGDIHLTWTVRNTPDFQTNKNLYYARSGDNGSTWTRTDGSSYPLPFGETHSEMVVEIPEGSSLINQTSTAVDQHDNPIIASWWAPGSQQGDHTRQYMLAHYDGAEWRTSQITNRPPESKTGGGSVRELGRPIVMVDDDDRTLVVMRYEERGNVITVAHSKDRENWDFVDLTTEDLGDYEPSFDRELWEQENVLNLLYQPVGLGQQGSTISVLEWDARSFFERLESPKLTLRVDRFTGQVSLVNSSDEPIAVDQYTVASANGLLADGEWQGLAAQGTPGWQTSAAGPSALSEHSSVGLSFDPQNTASLGQAINNQLAFGVDAPQDLTLSYAVADGDIVSGEVVYEGESPNNLTLLVDPGTGQARLINTSNFAVDFDAYTITSESGALRYGDDDWRSLHDSGEAGEGWDEANPDATRVSELQNQGAVTLESGEGYDLGGLFDTSLDQDLGFEFLVAGESQERTGVVRFVSLAPVLTGDYNNNGVVDAADFTIWRDALNTFASLPSDATPGLVTALDYEVWLAHFGETAAATIAPAAPEPMSLVTVVYCLVPLLVFPRFMHQLR